MEDVKPVVFNSKGKDMLILAIKYVLPIILALAIFIGFKICKSKYNMKEINLNTYVSLVSATKQSLVFVTSNDCDTCVKTKKLLNKMLQGSKIKTYEINIDKLNDEEKNTFMSTLEETNEVTAPALLMVAEDKLVSSFYGPFDEDLIITYLQDNNLVRKINTNE